MLARCWAMVFGLSIIVLFLTANVRSDGTIVDVGLFTQSDCVGQVAAPYVGNASVGLGTCLATPGAVSINVPKTICTGNDVALYGYANSVCSGTYDSIDYDRDGGCYSWFNGAFGSIVLSCNTADPGSIVSYTTASAGPVATNPAGANPASSTATGTNTGSIGNTSSPASGWDSLSTPARSGIIAGGVIFVILVTVFSFITSRNRNRATIHVAPMQQQYERTMTYTEHTRSNF